MGFLFPQLAVIPVLMGPLQIFLAALPAIITALAGLVAALTRPRVLAKLLKLIWSQKLAVLLLLVAIGSVWIIRHEIAEFTVSRQAVASGGAWPETRGGPRRQGRTDAANGPQLGGLIWAELDHAGDAFLASPAVAGGRIYIASAKLGVFNNSGAIHCLDKTTGALLWSTAPPGYEPTFSSPVVQDNYLVCGEGLHKTRDARLICLDLSAGQEGSLLWALPTRSHVECTPVIAGDKVVVGAGDDGYYCVSLRDAEDGKPKVLWHQPGTSYPDAETALAVIDGRVYAGLGFGGQALCVLDLETGKELLRKVTPYPVFTPPSFADGTLFIGMGNGNLVESADAIRAREVGKLRRAGADANAISAAISRLRDGGEVWCINRDDLSLRWSYQCESTVLSSVCVTDDSVIFVTRAGRVISLNHNGELKAAHDLGETVLGSPAVDGERVYILAAGGRLYTLSLADLAPLWSQQLDSGIVNTSSPVLDDGRLYVGTDKSGLLCIGSTAIPEARIWPGGLGGPGAAGNPMHRDVGPAGDFLWNFPPERRSAEGPAWVVAAPAFLDNRLYVPFLRGRPGVTCLLPADRPEDPPAVAWHATAQAGVRLTPAVVGDRAFFVDATEGQEDATIRAVSAADGGNLWSLQLENMSIVSLVADTRRLLLGATDNALICCDHNGNELWRGTPGRVIGSPCLIDQIGFLATSDPAMLWAIDLPTGRTLWHRPLDAIPTGGPVVWRDEVWVNTTTDLAVFSIFDGSPIPSRSQPGGGTGQIMLSQGMVGRQTTAGRAQILFGVDHDAWLGPALSSPAVPMPMSGERICLWGKKDGILILEPGSNLPWLWCETDWLGRPSTPLIAGGRSLFAGIDGWGLVCFGRAQPR